MNTSQIVWTAEIVKEWLETAALVEKALPPVYRKGVAGPRWTIIREWYELLWDEDEPTPDTVKFIPTNQQVSMWEEVVLRWFKLIDSDKDKKIVWMRATGCGWTKIGKKVGFSRQTVSVRHERALEQLAARLTSFYQKISTKQNPYV